MTKVSVQVDLMISMLEMIFRGRDLSESKDFRLPNGEHLTHKELCILFESYTQN